MRTGEFSVPHFGLVDIKTSVNRAQQGMHALFVRQSQGFHELATHTTLFLAPVVWR